MSNNSLKYFPSPLNTLNIGMKQNKGIKELTIPLILPILFHPLYKFK